MKLLLVVLLFTQLKTLHGSIRNVTGLYEFADCSCTVLNCLEQNSYQLNHHDDGSLTIIYRNYLSARGRVTLLGNGSTRLSIDWLPLMDFDTNCTGIWNPRDKTVPLNCGDQYRYCRARLRCTENSGPCWSASSQSSRNQMIYSICSIVFVLTKLFN